MLDSLNLESCNALSELILSDAEYLGRLDCSGKSLGCLDLDGLTRLQEVYCSEQNISGVPMSKTLNLKDYAENGINRISSVQGYDSDGTEIETSFDSETGIVTFASIPATVNYIYYTGLRDEAMDVTLSLNGEPVNEGGSGGSGGGCEVGDRLPIGLSYFALLMLLAFHKKL